VRHPIYLGLPLLALGEGIAFGCGPAVVTVLVVVVPSFLWRARVEEKVLLEAFGERYQVYRKHTKIMIPYLL